MLKRTFDEIEGLNPSRQCACGTMTPFRTDGVAECELCYRKRISSAVSRSGEEEAREWYDEFADVRLTWTDWENGHLDITLNENGKWRDATIPEILAAYAANIRQQERARITKSVVTTGHGEHDHMECAVCRASYNDWGAFKHKPNCKFAAAIGKGEQQ